MTKVQVVLLFLLLGNNTTNIPAAISSSWQQNGPGRMSEQDKHADIWSRKLDDFAAERLNGSMLQFSCVKHQSLTPQG